MNRAPRWLGTTALLLGASLLFLVASILFFAVIPRGGEQVHDGFTDHGNGFATKLLGNPLPHFPKHVSLYRLDKGGKWKPIWHAISSRINYVTTWEDKVLFGAYTSMDQVDRRAVRVLLYERSTDSRVDITGPLLRHAGRNTFSEIEDAEIKREGDVLHWSMWAGASVEFDTPLSLIADFAREVRGKGQVRVFDEFAVYEE